LRKLSQHKPCHWSQSPLGENAVKVSLDELLGGF
jgi:hypothetical protein